MNPVTVYAMVPLGAFGTVLFALERYYPLRRVCAAPLGRRVLVNVTVAAIAFGATILAVQPAASLALGRSAKMGIGLVPLLPGPSVLRAAIAFALMDLLFYYWHQLNHRAAFFWRFHNVHHIDPDLDVTTAFRFHFGEIALSAGFRVVQILAIGPSPGTYFAYEIAFQAITVFHHSNVRLPIRVERVLNRMLVTPRMHGVHHSEILRESRSNYGVVFPFWDRLHRTLRLNVPQSQVTIGIAGYSLAGDHGLWKSLAAPFRRQRDYWTRPGGEKPDRNDAELARDRAHLAD